jgi:hypothetical protein
MTPGLLSMRGAENAEVFYVFFLCGLGVFARITSVHSWLLFFLSQRRRERKGFFMCFFLCELGAFARVMPENNPDYVSLHPG